MNITSFVKNMTQNGGISSHRKKADSAKKEDCVKILLLTHRNSDNMGDQMIEACDVCLLSAVMKNLNKNCRINSCGISVIPNEYLTSRDGAMLEEAERVIREADIVIFGGAPVFNYLYQNFYERTAIIIEIAQKHQKPVLFSAIGIESYDESDQRCQRLKKKLNYNCVKQITTRDNLEALKKYKTNEGLIIGPAADPAVFSGKIFESFRSEKIHNKIGIFILRRNGFTDNQIPFTKEDSAELWINLIRELEKRGYDYELLTSGYCEDEAFLEWMIGKYNIDVKKCVFHMDSPEKLVAKISSYEAVVSCRLHPSIIAFSLDVPSVGIIWNPKVRGFYRSIGYEDRIFEAKGMQAEAIAGKLEQVIREGVKKSEMFLMSIYHSLFYGIAYALEMERKELTAWTFEKLLKEIPAYTEASAKRQGKRAKRKFRRIYKIYNECLDQKEALQKRVEELERENDRLKEKS